jgi:GR25 family glycosyltransferase involved in LPS biosynthesis
MEKFKDFFDIIVYINCDHRTDRKEHIEKIFYPLGYTNETLIRISADYLPNNSIRGCAQSHIKALKLVQEHPEWNRPLIIEDDFYFKHPNSIQHLPKFFELIQEWDVLMLGFNQNPSNINYSVCSQYTPIIRIFKAYSAIAYSVRHDYIQKIIDCFSHSLRAKGNKDYPNAIDVQWNSLQRKDKWFSIRPKIAWQIPSYSDIEKRNVNYHNL